MAANSAYVQPNEFVPVPSSLFGPLLERMSDLDEVRCALRVIFLLHPKQGTFKYVSVAEVMSDPVVRCGDDGESVERALDIELEGLPSRSEIFFIFPDLPHQKFSNEKARRILGWEPQDQLEQFWKKAKS